MNKAPDERKISCMYKTVDKKYHQKTFLVKKADIADETGYWVNFDKVRELIISVLPPRSRLMYWKFADLNN